MMVHLIGNSIELTINQYDFQLIYQLSEVMIQDYPPLSNKCGDQKMVIHALLPIILL